VIELAFVAGITCGLLAGALLVLWDEWRHRE